MRPIVARTCFFAAFCHVASAAQHSRLAVSCSGQDGFLCEEVPWHAVNWAAQGVFDPAQNETGWARLWVETPEPESGTEDDAVAYGAGFVEGFLTADLIADLWHNQMATRDLPGQQVQEFILEQRAFLAAKVGSARGALGAEARYWKHVGLTLLQLRGMSAGYAAAAASRPALPSFSETEFVALNWMLELEDIQKAVDVSKRPRFDKMERTELSDYISRTTHCTALFRVTPELDDILVGHTTWCPYNFMLRVFKVYQLRYADAAADAVLQTGYPALLSSSDDFYVTSRRLLITETTNSVFNSSLYDLVSPQTVPYWIRNVVATRLAASAKEWHELFYRWNSGTYNNQWVVVDYNKFIPRQPLPPWTFVVSESLPGPYAHGGEDLTMALQRGHWPSYNIPYFPDVYELSGYPELVQKHGVEHSYQLTPRASIFRRQADAVDTLEDLQRFMRFNGYGHSDPLAKSPQDAIASRGDLRPVGPSAYGAIDAKCMNSALVDALAVLAVSGPTTQGQPPFAWSGAWAALPHSGLPEVYNFSWQTLSAGSLKAFGEGGGGSRPGRGELGASVLYA